MWQRSIYYNKGDEEKNNNNDEEKNKSARRAICAEFVTLVRNDSTDLAD